MLCDTCNKLAYLNVKKTCAKCQGTVLISISVVCDTCSNLSKSCSACLKRFHSTPVLKNVSPGCRSCGR